MSLTRLWLLSVVSVALLAGCGRVVVFGHVLGEGKGAEVEQPADDATSASPAAGPASTASAASSGAKPEPGAGDAAARKGPRNAAAAVPALKSIALKVAPQATDNVASDIPFVPEQLLEALRTELRVRKLLDENNPQLTGTAEVQVSEVSVRPSTNAVLFGYKMMAGTLIGDVHFSGIASNTPPDLHVLADTRLTIAVDNEKKEPLGPLYRRFALLMADQLQGVESKPDPGTVGGQPRY